MLAITLALPISPTSTVVDGCNIFCVFTLEYPIQGIPWKLQLRLNVPAVAVPNWTPTLNCDKVDFIDSPATTSATTYKIQSNIEYSGSTTNYINRTGDDANVIGYDPRVCSAITVTEILA